MSKINEAPFILTTLNEHNIILRKDNPYYKPTGKDMPLGIECVVANSDRLVEITKDLNLDEDNVVWLLND